MAGYSSVIAAIRYGLYDNITRQGASVGEMFAIVTNLARFTDGVAILPLTYQHLLRTIEITRRIAGGKDTPPES